MHRKPLTHTRVGFTRPVWVLDDRWLCPAHLACLSVPVVHGSFRCLSLLLELVAVGIWLTDYAYLKNGSCISVYLQCIYNTAVFTANQCTPAPTQRFRRFRCSMCVARARCTCIALVLYSVLVLFQIRKLLIITQCMPQSFSWRSHICEIPRQGWHTSHCFREKSFLSSCLVCGRGTVS